MATQPSPFLTDDALEASYDATLEALAATIDLRDRRTAGYSYRAAHLTTQLAAWLGFSREQLRAVRRGALLHDVGKLALPEHLLDSSQTYSPEEWSLIKQHPLLAAQWLRRLPYLKIDAHIPQAHHEHWDGSGYPQGLRQVEIPYSARIFAVAELYTALTFPHRNQSGHSHRQALETLSQLAHSRLDPDTVEAFIQCFPTTAQVS